jgi:photosystem II stability/assembly factor-like uncharacterized protein
MACRSLSRLVLAAVFVAASLPLLSAQTVQTMPDMHWRMIGPFRGGRTRAAAGVPSQPNVFYMGQVDGGVWKSTDYGRTWRPIFDHEPTQSIGAIAVAPSDPSIVYVASGEGLHRPDLSVGDGFYRSDDAGRTWTHLGLRNSQQIPAIAVDPQNPNIVYAAVLGHPYGPSTERGIYKSTDGGRNWTRILYKNDRTGGSDVVLDPKNPNIVYASLWEETLGPWEDNNSYDGTQGGLFKSTDGGKTWHQLKNGLPSNLVQINVAVAPSNPSRLYAVISTTVPNPYASGIGDGVYRSDDAGATWFKITNDPRPAMKIGGGDLPIPVVDPQNDNTVYVASIVCVRSTDGGKTWISLRGAPGGDDYQNLWINPNNPNIILLVADQGAIVSVNAGKTWSSWYNQPTAQLYHVAATSTFPYQVCAGQQESGSVCISSRGNDGEITFANWHPAGIIEYGYAAPDPLHPNIVFGAGRTQVTRYNAITGDVQNVTPLPMDQKGFRADRTEPILFSPVDPHILYYAANHLFKTTNYGHTWQIVSPDLSRPVTGQIPSVPPLSKKQQDTRRGVIYSVAASYKNTSTIWAGTDDGLVWITRDAGAHWSNITPPGIAPWCKIAQIDASRFDDNSAYVAVNCQRINNMHPYAFRTHNGGKTWTAIDNGLASNGPVNAVRADSRVPGLLYAATELDVYVSFDDGSHWQPLQYNLPHTSMRDLLVHDNDLIVATHGRSFWILDDLSPLRTIARAKNGSLPMLFPPATAWRIRRDNYTDTPYPPDLPAGQNPPDGAIIDYDLPHAATHVRLEILDFSGKVIRRYSSSAPVRPTPEKLRTELIPPYWPLITGPMPTSAGMHRWVWNLRATRPTATQYSYPISAVPHRTPLTPQGPPVLPGNYTVRLVVDGHNQSQPLTVKMDPRVHTSMAELTILHTAEVSVAAALSSVAKADLAAHSVQEQLNAQLKAPAGSSLATQLAVYTRQLKDLINGTAALKPAPAHPSPGLDAVNNNAMNVYGMLDQSDQPPTEPLLAASRRVESQVMQVAPAWKAFEAQQLPAINRILAQAHRPPINPAQKPAYMPPTGDEE